MGESRPAASLSDEHLLIAECNQLAVQRAADVLLKMFRQPLQIELKTESSWADFVSTADHAAEAEIVSTILQEFPDDTIVTEETKSQEGSSGRQWIIDPIDGTTNFVRGLPNWCISVACKDQEGLLSAAVADAVGKETFTAVRGQGVKMNGKSVAALDEKVKGAQTMIASHVGRDRRLGAPRKRALAEAIQEFSHISIGSAALSLAWTACGRVDMTYYECPLKQWDLAAGQLLCAEAGLEAPCLEPATTGLYPRLIAGSSEACQALLTKIEAIESRG